MKQEKLDNLLNELADRTAEPVRPGLAEDIKQQIPEGLGTLRGGLNTINIIVDLRINRLAAAAAIIIAMILLVSFFGGRDSEGGNIYQEGKFFLRYLFGRGETDALTVRSRYEQLVQEGKEVVYYGDSVDARDSNAVLMQWKISDGKYKVIFSDFSIRQVSAEELIRLQAQMLQKRRK